MKIPEIKQQMVHVFFITELCGGGLSVHELPKNYFFEYSFLFTMHYNLFPTSIEQN